MSRDEGPGHQPVGHSWNSRNCYGILYSVICFSPFFIVIRTFSTSVTFSTPVTVF